MWFKNSAQAKNLWLLAYEFGEVDLSKLGKLTVANKAFLEAGLKWYYNKLKGKKR